MIHRTACPLCGSENIAAHLTTKDYQVTQESFDISHCNNCNFLFTQDIPEENNSAKYYQSDAYISHSDTSKGLINRLYHFVRKFTLNQKKHLIKNTSGQKQGEILDIGSGTGSFLSTMKHAGWQVSGIEPDEIARGNAEKMHHISSVRPDAIDTFQTASFDVITMWHVLEHVHGLDDQMKQLQGLLKPGGRLFIAVPNHTSYDAIHFGKYWAAWDLPRHLYHFSPDTMKRLVGKYGFEIIRYKPMWFDSFYVSMLSEKYISGKSHFLKAVFVGMVSNWKALFNPKNCSSVIYVMKKKSQIT